MRAAYIIGLVISAILTAIYAFQGFYPEFIAAFSNAIFPFLAGAASLLAYFAMRRYGHEKKTFSSVWLCFTLGMLLWFLGETGWAMYTFFLGTEIPYPSLADIFWLGGYIPFLIALYFYVKIFASALSKRTVQIVMMATIILSVLLAFALIIPIVGAEEDFVALIMDLAYPLLDLALFSTALLGLLIFRKGALGKSWLLINAGILANVGADIIFSYTTANGTYYNGHPSELLFIWGYILFALAFYIHMKEL
ncbi:MAG: hypothetical protein QXZ25_03640 [Candidatus Bathyarchaeia archaeon]